MNAEAEPVYGRRPVLELLRGGHRRVQEVAVLAEARGRALEDLLRLARRQGVKVAFRTRDQLSAMARTPHHQGVVARVAAWAYASLEGLLGRPRALGEPALFLVLDQVQDPGNLGNLVRTAEALGVHGILVPRHEAVGLTPVVAKAAAGALEHLPVARVGNLAQALDVLKKEGCWVVGGVTAGAGTVPPWELDLRGPAVLVLGSEGRGLRPLVARSCDALTRIPLAGQVGSLNVAAAGAALLYEVCRQRSRAPASPEQKKSVDTARPDK